MGRGFSDLSKGIDIIIKASFTTEVDRGGRPLRTAIGKIEFNNDTVFVLNPRQPNQPNWVIGSFFIFNGYPSEEIINRFKTDPDTKLIATLKATHAITGSVFVNRFMYTKNDLREGEFSAKHNCDIIKTENK